MVMKFDRLALKVWRNNFRAMPDFEGPYGYWLDPSRLSVACAARSARLKPSAGSAYLVKDGRPAHQVEAAVLVATVVPPRLQTCFDHNSSKSANFSASTYHELQLEEISG